jgi:hypothetical protein
MRQRTHPKLRWLLQLTADLKFFPIPHIHRTWPPDFYLFLKLKTKLHGKRFGSNEGVMEEAINEFFEDQNRESYFDYIEK